MTEKLTDAELIKRVAERLGLTQCKSEKLSGVWKYPNGELENPSVWLTSVDAALGILGGRNYDIFHRESGYQFWLWPDNETMAVLGKDKSLPRAILEAFLEEIK